MSNSNPDLQPHVPKRWEDFLHSFGGVGISQNSEPLPEGTPEALVCLITVGLVYVAFDPRGENKTKLQAVSSIKSLWEVIQTTSASLTKTKTHFISIRNFQEFKDGDRYYPCAHDAALKLARTLLSRLWEIADPGGPFLLPDDPFPLDFFVARFESLQKAVWQIAMEDESNPSRIFAGISQESAAANMRFAKPRAGTNCSKRSWTQLDLDNAIREYKAQRASTYNDLLEGVKRGGPGATKSARGLFGRNQLVGVRSPAMVTNSPAWQRIAAELRLSDGSKKGRRKTGHRIGMDMALEQEAVADGESAFDNVIRRETMTQIKKSMPQLEAEATIEKLQHGEMTDDQVRELVKEYVDQQQDERTQRIRQIL